MKKRIFAMLLAVLLFASPMLDADVYLSLRKSLALAEETADSGADAQKAPAAQDVDKEAEKPAAGAGQNQSGAANDAGASVVGASEGKDQAENGETPEPDDEATDEPTGGTDGEEQTEGDQQPPEGDADGDDVSEGGEDDNAPDDCAEEVQDDSAEAEENSEIGGAWNGYAEIASGAAIRHSDGNTAKTLARGIVLAKGNKNGIVTVTYACYVQDVLETRTGKVSESDLTMKDADWTQTGDVQVGGYMLKAIDVEIQTEGNEGESDGEETGDEDEDVPSLKLVRLPDGTVVAYDDLAEVEREELLAVFGVELNDEMTDEDLYAEIFAQYGVKAAPAEEENPQVMMPDGSAVSLGALLQMNREDLLATFGNAAEAFAEMSAAQLAAYILSAQMISTLEIEAVETEEEPPVVPKPQPVDGIKYTNTWWDNHTADDRLPVKATVEFSIPLTEEKAGGQYPEPQYKIVDGYVYEVIEGEEVTYELVYDPERATYVNTFDPESYDADTYYVEVSGRDGGAFPDGAKDINVVWDNVPGYQLREEGDSITLVKLKDVVITKKWLDSGLGESESFRPSIDEWLGSGYLGNTLYGSDGTEITLNRGMVTEDGDNWKLIVRDVPAFVNSDIPVVYHVEEGFDPLIVYPSEMKNSRGYETKQYNEGADQQSGANHEIYEGGYSESVLKGTVAFEFDKVWLDGDENIEHRPAVTFYLYRYVEGSGESDINNASPVRGHDSMSYAQGASEFQKHYQTERPTTIKYAKDLDEFDKDGKKYNYFIMERMSASTFDDPERGRVTYNYQSTDANGKPISYLDINGVVYEGSNHTQVSTGNTTIYNRRVGTYEPIVQKTWASLAIQAMDGSVTVALQSRRLKDGGEWEYVHRSDGSIVTKKQDGFNSEHRDMEFSFDDSVNRYDNDGYELEFRIVELDASVGEIGGSAEAAGDGNAQYNPAYYQDGAYFLSNGYRFEVSYEGNHITNRLVGKTDILVRKTFNPGIEDAKKASIWVRVERDAPFEADEALPMGAMPDGDSAFILQVAGTPSYDPNTQTSTLDYDITDLSRYDADGREYKYTLAEMANSQYPAMLDDTPYHFASMSNSVTEKDDSEWGKRKELTNSITNVTDGEGESLVFHVTKEWVDEGDLLHRQPVEWGLYYKGDKVWPVDGYGVLTANNDWHTEFRYPIHTAGLSPEEAAELRNYSNYTVREISVGGNSVQGDLENYYSLGSGKCVLTNDHIYQVVDDVPAKRVSGYGETYGDCYVKNIRVGELKIKVTKEWNLGDLTVIDDTPISAQFRITNDYNDQVKNFEISLSNPEYTSEWLPKYDSQGRVITYTVEEISLNNDYPFANGTIDMGEYLIVSKQTGESETIGYRHTHDLQERSFSNTRMKTGTITINKVWHDDGSEGRPDIVLNLIRVDTQTGERTNIRIDKIWNTQHNEWFWTCGFGTQPLYNANGYLYEYYVTEVIPQASEYTGKQQYYNGTVQPRASGTDAEETFAPCSGNGSSAKAAAWDGEAYIGGDPGTIINTRERFMRIDAYKHWQGKPNWIKDTELPEIVVQLQRRLTADSGEAGYIPYTLSDNPYNTADCLSRRLNTVNKFKFTELNVPYYDAYGRKYESYRLIETSENLAYTTTIGVDGNYDITNQYTGFPKIKIGVDKLWDWLNMERPVTGEDKYPKLTFQLWQSFSGEGFSSKKQDTLIGTAVIDAGDVDVGKTKAEPTVYFVNEEDGSDLFPTYLWLFKNGINEKVYYTYWIKEFDENGKELNAYEVTFDPAGDEGSSISGKHLTNDADVEAEQYIFGAKNTYKKWDRKITAQKVWLDDSNAYKTHPTDTAPLSYKLWRTVDSSKTTPASEAAVDRNACEEVTGAGVSWSTTGDTWVCTFSAQGTEMLPEYRTDNKKYYYFVTETLAAPYDQLYRQQARTAALSITNELKPVELYAKKAWKFTKDGSEVTLSDAQRDDVIYFAGLNTTGASKLKLTYRVTAKDGDGNAINLFANGTTYTKEQSVDYNNALLLGDQGYRLLSDLRLPQYVLIGENVVEVIYTVEEVKVGNQVVTGGTAGCMSVTNDPTVHANNTFTGKATNAVEIIQINLVKEWEDEKNREGKRPSTVYYALKANNDKSKTKAITNNRTGTVATEPEHKASYYLPTRDMNGLLLSYTFTETAIDMYTTQVKITGETDYTTSLTSSTMGDGDTAYYLNSYKPHKIRLKASKDWAPESYAYWEILQPDEITVELQQKTSNAAESAWRTIGGPVTLHKSENWAWPADVVWLVDCFKEKTSSTAISTSTMYVYRMVEAVDGVKYASGADMGNGLTLSVVGESESLITGVIDGKTWTEEDNYWVRDAANGGFKMTNNANEKTLNVEKVWQDSKRPTDEPDLKVAFKVYYYRTSEASSPKDAIDKGVAHELTQLAFVLPDENNQWTKTIVGLPTHDKAGKALSFFAQEQKSYYDPDIDASFLYITSPAYTAEGKNEKTTVTNTRKTVSLTVNKEWVDSENRYNTRKILTFKLYRSKDASAWTPCGSIDMEVGTTQVQFTDLPALYIDDNGMVCAYYYKVVETPKTGSLQNYSTTVTFAEDTAVSVVTSDNDAYAYVRGNAGQTVQDAALGTAKFKNSLDTVTKTINKSWDDQNTKYGTRPTTVTFTAKRHTGACKAGDVCTLGQNVPLLDGKNLTVELTADAWTSTVEDLPKTDENGNVYAYHFIENVLGYKQSDEVNGNTITTTNTEKTTNIKVTKNWSDGSNAYGARPDEIWVQLEWSTKKASGYSAVKNVEPVALNSDWTATFNNLPIAKAGVQLYYRVKELGIKKGNTYELPAGYTAANSGISAVITAAERTGTATQDTTLSNTLKTTEVKVSKTWEDEENKYNTQPAELKFTVQHSTDGENWEDVKKNGAVVEIVLTKADSWAEKTCSGLPTHDGNNKEYRYRAVESKPENYDVTKNNIAFKDGKAEFENTLKTVDITIKKTWVDEANKYGTRPAVLSFAIERRTANTEWAAVMKDGSAVVIELLPTEKEKEYEGLPKLDADGNVYSYRAVETVPFGYSNDTPEKAFVDGEASFENKMKTTNIKVTKNWADGSDTYGVRPDEIWVQLEWSTKQATGYSAVPTVAPVTLDSDWTKTFENLPIAKAGDQLYYRVKELGIKNGKTYTLPAGYEAANRGISSVITAVEKTGTATQDTTLTNTIETTNIKVTKAWEDDDDTYGVRPEDIWVQLQWSTDEDQAPNSFSAVPTVAPVTLDSDWTKTFENLPIAKAGDQLYYRVKELGIKKDDDTYELPAGYEAANRGISSVITAVEKTGTATQDTTLTNTIETTNIKVTKAWEDDDDAYGVRPDEIWVQLEWSTDKDDADSYSAVPTIDPVKLDSNWTAKFEDLPIAKAGARLYYRVKELGIKKNDDTYALPAGYNAKNGGISSVITAEETTDTQDTKLTNTIETTNIEVTKAWEDDDDTYGVRPDEIWVQLEWSTVKESGYSAVPTIDPVKLDRKWSAKFENLPIAKAGDQLYYRVTELGIKKGGTYVLPEGYTAANRGISAVIKAEEKTGTDTQNTALTNTLKTVSITVNKTWLDASNKYGTRPDAIEFELQQSIDGKTWNPTYANGAAVVLKLAGDMQAKQWTKEYTGLPERDKEGKLLSYRAFERIPFGYTADSKDMISWTNSLQITDLELMKAWSDQEDAYGTRPKSVTVRLQKLVNNEWTDVGISITLSEDKQWRGVFEDVPMIDSKGKVIQYRAVEDAQPGYTCDPAEFIDNSAELTTLTNELITIKLQVNKSWRDNNNEKRIRPQSITAKLQKLEDGIWVDVLKNGKAVEVTITKQDNWTATIDDLPKMDSKGNEVQYRIVETVPKGYKNNGAVVFVNGVAALRNDIIEEPQRGGFGHIQMNVGDCFE